MATEKYGTYDTSIVYDYKKHPDIVAGRCDNCGSTHFESKVGNYQFERKCRKCGMRKLI